MSDTSTNILTLPVIQSQDRRRFIFLDIVRIIMTLRLRKHFEQIYVSGINQAQQLCVGNGAIVVANTQSIWDEALFFYLSEMLGNRAFLFHDMTKLEQSKYLQWCGVLPLSVDFPLLANNQLRHAIHLCDEPTQFWLFPQLKSQPSHALPLRFQRTIMSLATGTNYPIIPTSIRYMYNDSTKPSAYIHFGSSMSSKATHLDVESSVLDGLHKIDEYYQSGTDDEFTTTFKRSVKRPSMLLTMFSKFASWTMRNDDD